MAFLLISASASAETLEAVRAAAQASFPFAGYRELLPDPALKPVQAKPVPPVNAAAARYVRVEGRIDLSGTVYVPKGTHFVSVSLSGSTDIQDSSGHIRSGYTSVHHTAHLYVNGSWVSDTARPSLYVSLYKDGRYIGSARVDGSIRVSGFVSGDWVRVSGWGTLSGDILVDDN